MARRGGVPLRPKHLPRAAFTFVEVMVSLMILSVGIVAVLESLQASVRALAISGERLGADVRIHEILAALEDQASAAMASDVSFDSGFHLGRDDGFLWSTDIVEIGGTEARQLYRANIRVWREGGFRDYRAGTYLAVADY